MYAITRIIPAVNSKKLLNEVAHDNIKLMLAYYSLVRGCCVEQLKKNQFDFELLQEMAQMAEERITYLNATIEALKVVI